MEIEFQIGQGSGHPHIPVYVNGEGPFTFTLDTGATVTTISKSLAEKLGIEMYECEENAFATGAGGGKIQVKFAKVERLEIGSIIIENEEVGVIDFDSIFGESCFTPGIIGYTTLKDYRLSVNYPTRKMRLDKVNGSDFSESDGIDWFDFEYIEDTHLVGISTMINGSGPYELVMDTGSGGTVITPQLAEELGLSKDDSVGQLRVGSPNSGGCEEGCQGIGGFAQGYPVQLDRFNVGKISQENITVGVIDLKVVSPRGSIIHGGIIGYPFLKDFEVIVDYPNKRYAFVSV